MLGYQHTKETGIAKEDRQMDKRNRLNAIAAMAAFGVLGCFSIYVMRYSSDPAATACLGVVCLAITSFVAGYVNGRG